MTLTALPFHSFPATGEPSITLFPAQPECTVAQAADILGIPESDVIELLDAGEIVSRSIGNRRVVSADSLSDYDRETTRLQNEALDELTQQAQELGFYR